MGIEALLLSQVITITGSTGQVVTKQADGSLALEDAAGGIGGSTGTTDNAVLRADGTGGATAQGSGVTISDNSEVSIVSGAVGAVPMRIRAAASQTGNLTEWQNSAGVNVLRILPAGGMDHFGISPWVFLAGTFVFTTSYKFLGWSGMVIGWSGATGVNNSSVEEFGFVRSAVNHCRLRSAAGVDSKLQIGTLRLTGLSTANPGVAGEVWNDGGTLKISAG